MATQTQNEFVVYASEKQLLAEARERRLAGHAPVKKAKHGNNRVDLSEIEDDMIEVTVEMDDAGDFDWRIALKEANGE